MTDERRMIEDGDVEVWKWRHDQLLKRLESLEKRVGFAQTIWGECLYCERIGTKPGTHHNPNCPLHREAYRDSDVRT